jgi:hypothetical protein
LVALAVGVVIGVAASNLGGSETASPSISPAIDGATPTQEPDPVDPVEPSPSGAVQFTELDFGQSLTVVSGDGSEETLVTLSKPTLAKCQYPDIGCTPPETGDRAIQVEITIENTGSSTATWGTDYFVLEFADGTQVSTSDGNAYEYGTSNTMDYEVKVRPNSTFRSALVFEAPNGPFSIPVLTNTFEGEPFASWS